MLSHRREASSDSELLAALGTTTGEYSAAVLGGHTSTETVGAGALDDAGLESTFHDGRSKMNRTRAGRKRVAILGRRGVIINGVNQGLTNRLMSALPVVLKTLPGPRCRAACGEAVGSARDLKEYKEDLNKVMTITIREAPVCGQAIFVVLNQLLSTY